MSSNIAAICWLDNWIDDRFCDTHRSQEISSQSQTQGHMAAAHLHLWSSRVVTKQRHNLVGQELVRKHVQIQLSPPRQTHNGEVRPKQEVPRKQPPRTRNPTTESRPFSEWSFTSSARPGPTKSKFIFTGTTSMSVSESPVAMMGSVTEIFRTWGPSIT